MLCLPPAPALRAAALAAAFAAATGTAFASSHREAPFITTAPKVDATDFYMFRSYEAGRSDYVTLIANYLPLQDAYGGPNYFKMDPNALYEIHVDNNGDAREDLTFQFRFRNELRDIQVPVGNQMVSIPLTQAGAVSSVGDANLNVTETYTVDVVRGNRRAGSPSAVTRADGGQRRFPKPVDNIGVKTIADYASYAASHVFGVNIPGCSMPGKVFVGQRKDPFAVNLGTIFDLVNAPASVLLDPALRGAAPNTIDDKNVTTLALEVHRSCLTAGSESVIGAWTTASLRQGQLLSGAPRSGYQATSLNGGPWVQVSRLGMPLVNEVVIGLKDKDRFNASKPADDGQFATYVTNPTLPVLMGLVLTGDATALAPTNLPRNDLVTTFLTGITGVNRPANVTPSEMLRLNTAIPPVAFASQNRLGVVGNALAGGSDNAGFPNGRRPKDDVVDIALIAVLGGLCVANGDTNAFGLGSACNPAAVPALLRAAGPNGLPNVFNVHDAVDQATVPLLPGFPYLATPIGGTSN
ncbi:MAG TPA: DUF4331 domain-containing protein [Methylibium sp.]|nr:DUF4331 domain-containing protein [Methylibium sp.]